MKENLVYKKSTDFALEIIHICRSLSEEKKEYVLSKQLLRSGTSIGANIREALFAHSRKEFIAKMNIALKEAAETEYWIELTTKSGYLDEKVGNDIMLDCVEVKKLLHAIIKTSKSSDNNS